MRKKNQKLDKYRSGGGKPHSKNTAMENAYVQQVSGKISDTEHNGRKRKEIFPVIHYQTRADDLDQDDRRNADAIAKSGTIPSERIKEIMLFRENCILKDVIRADDL